MIVNNNNIFIGSKLLPGEVLCPRCCSCWCVTSKCNLWSNLDSKESNKSIDCYESLGFDSAELDGNDLQFCSAISEDFPKLEELIAKQSVGSTQTKNKIEIKSMKKYSPSYKEIVKKSEILKRDFKVIIRSDLIKSNPLIPQPVKQFIGSENSINGRDSANYVNGIYRTIVGGLNINEHEKLLNVILYDRQFDKNPQNKMDSNSRSDSVKTINFLRDWISRFGFKSRVGSLKGKPATENLNKRRSLSINLNENTVQELSEILIPVIEKCAFWDSDVLVHPTHANIILYTKGGKFDIHKDKILEKPNSVKDFSRSKGPYFDSSTRGFQMYSMVYCLGSNIDDRIRLNEGNTIIYTSVQSLSHFNNVDNSTIEYKYESKFAPHIYNESVIPGEFVLFPSNLYHSSSEIFRKGKYKLVLKMDFWISLKEIDKKSIDRNFVDKVSTYNNVFCNCKLCNPYRQRIPVYRYHLLNIFTKSLNTTSNWSNELTEIILSYLVDSDYNTIVRKVLNKVDPVYSKGSYKSRKLKKNREFFHDLRVQRGGYLPPYQYLNYKIESSKWRSYHEYDYRDDDDCNGDY